MHRASFPIPAILLAYGLGSVGSLQAQGQVNRRPPNIVLILADDLGWGDVGFNGRTDWRTPNLDALARQGALLKRFYAAAAVCCPSRAALLTGKYTIHCGVTNNNADLPESETTIAEALKPLGYRTGLFGKWHHGKPRAGAKSFVHPMDQGFDAFFGFVDATQAHRKYPKTLWDGRSEIGIEGYADDLFAARAVGFIESQKEAPFFLFASFTNPHFRIEAPEESVAPFRGKFAERDPHDPANSVYAAMVERLDRNVGLILQALKKQKLTQNTFVFFTSDQGATFEVGNRGASAFHDSNRPFRGQKRTLWEGGIRVPAIAKLPGTIPAGSVVSEPMHAVDLLPTFLAAAGQAGTPAGGDGVNLLPALSAKAKLSPRTLFWEWRAEGASVTAAMLGDFKLVIPGGGKPELYNVADDPAERRDLAAIEPALLKRLSSEIQTQLQSERTPKP